MKKIYIIILIVLSLSFPVIACDMFMLQSINGYPLFTLPNSAGNFNDPYDYFEDFKSQANQTSGNRDGYGIIAYKIDNPVVDRDYMWYKTGIGNYFDENNPDEPFYEAISVLYDNPTIDKVLVHARSGTGGFGNHPFIFKANGKSYSFMHNGYVFNSVKQGVIDFLGQDWFNKHPSQWEGDFTSANTFIDSEILFHYLMYYILQYPDDIPTAFRYAFNNKQVAGIDMEYILKFNNNTISNFIMSDGTNTYIYRSSRLNGSSYNLSYQIYPNNFVAVKTDTSLNNTLAKNQFIKITPEGDIIDLSIEPILRTNFLTKRVETIGENIYKLHWAIENNDEISKFNIYRSANENFAQAEWYSDITVDDPNIYTFDVISSDLESPFYWIEVIYDDASSEITSNIPSKEFGVDPNEPEVDLNLSLYPNPFQNKLMISIESDEIIPIKIFNLKGQLLDELTYLPNNSRTVYWDISNQAKKIANGIYFLQFKHNNKTITKKVMRIK